MRGERGKRQTEYDILLTEILRVLAESKESLSAQEITKLLKDRGLNLNERTVRNRLEKMDRAEYIIKTGSRISITEKGLALLNRNTVFERLGEFSETVEYNMHNSTFNLYSMEGTVPANFAIIDKDAVEDALEIMQVVANSDLVTSRLITLFDEGETLGTFEIPEGKIGVGTISSTVYDIIMLNIGVVLVVESAGLLRYENHSPVGLLELINYSGTTISPGLLFIRGGYTSVYKVAVRGNGNVVTAIRSFSTYAIDDVEREIHLAEARGIGRTLAISLPMDNVLSLPVHKKALLIFQAGVNYLAPLYEKNFKPVMRINESLVEFKEFKDIDEFM